MTQNLPAKPVERLKMAMSTESVKSQFQNCLADSAPLFVASLIDLYSSDKYLQECEPGKVIMEALKAATLELPINRTLGFAYIIAYKEKGVSIPQFQISYKGLLQLAIRSGQYSKINADKVLTGELKKHDKLTGDMELGEPTGPEVVGYFAFIETVFGFRKSVYWTKQEVEAHAKRFSKSFGGSFSPWKTDFDAMAIKTVLKALLSKYGIMSVKMAQAISADKDDDPEASVQNEINNNANRDFIDIQPEPSAAAAVQVQNFDGSVTTMTVETAALSAEEMAEIQAQEAAEGPDF